MSDGPETNGILSILDEDECLSLLARSDVGRVAFTTSSGPQIYPVNYLVDNGTIVIRTSPYTPLGGFATGVVAFEVDALEPAMRRGWSVLVVGRSERVDDTDETIRLHHSGRLDPWAPGQRNLYVRITPQQITGRRIS